MPCSCSISGSGPAPAAPGACTRHGQGRVAPGRRAWGSRCHPGWAIGSCRSLVGDRPSVLRPRSGGNSSITRRRTQFLAESILLASSAASAACSPAPRQPRCTPARRVGRRDPRRGVVGRHRLGHRHRRARWPDAGRSSVSDAAHRDVANGMSPVGPCHRPTPSSDEGCRRGGGRLPKGVTLKRCCSKGQTFELRRRRAREPCHCKLSLSMRSTGS